MADSLPAACADPSVLASSATSAAAAAPSISAPAELSTKRSATEKPAGIGTAAAPSQMPPEPTSHGPSSTAADARRGTVSGTGLSQAADARAASGRASDTATDKASGIASDNASGTQAPPPAATAAAEQASEQQASALPVVPDGTAQVQQAGTDKVQQASRHAALLNAQLQPVPAKASLSQRGGSMPQTQNSMHLNGQAPPSLPGAEADGTAANEAAAQGSRLSKEPLAAPQAAMSSNEQLQAAALESTTASSQAAVKAGLSLPTPRSGTERHQLALEVWHGCMFRPTAL